MTRELRGGLRGAGRSGRWSKEGSRSKRRWLIERKEGGRERGEPSRFLLRFEDEEEVNTPWCFAAVLRLSDPFHPLLSRSLFLVYQPPLGPNLLSSLFFGRAPLFPSSFLLLLLLLLLFLLGDLASSDGRLAYWEELQASCELGWRLRKRVSELVVEVWREEEEERKTSWYVGEG